MRLLQETHTLVMASWGGGAFLEAFTGKLPISLVKLSQQTPHLFLGRISGEKYHCIAITFQKDDVNIGFFVPK